MLLKLGDDGLVAGTAGKRRRQCEADAPPQPQTTQLHQSICMPQHQSSKYGGNSDDTDDDVPLIDVVGTALQAGAIGGHKLVVKHTHNGVIGAAAAATGGGATTEFMVEYNCECSECANLGADVQDRCFLLHTDDFDALQRPPATTRAELGWDNRIVGRCLVFFWGKLGYTGWCSGAIVAYDEASQRHEITPFDATRDIKANLLVGSKSTIREWRFLRDGEDGTSVCDKLNQ